MADTPSPSIKITSVESSSNNLTSLVHGHPSQSQFMSSFHHHPSTHHHGQSIRKNTGDEKRRLSACSSGSGVLHTKSSTSSSSTSNYFSHTSISQPATPTTPSTEKNEQKIVGIEPALSEADLIKKVDELVETDV